MYRFVDETIAVSAEKGKLFVVIHNMYAYTLGEVDSYRKTIYNLYILYGLG